MSAAIEFTVNGSAVAVAAPGAKRLSDVLRDDLGLKGTKVGCNAGDCGACTVLLDGEQVCACMVPLGQAEGRAVESVEGLANGASLHKLQAAFHRHGAAQCGICTPAMLMAASDLLARVATPNEAEVKDALGGVLCRCTGYRKIIEAVLDIAGEQIEVVPGAGAAVGARLAKVDGLAKLNGGEIYGADGIPEDALWLRVVRSPHAFANFTLGDLDAFVTAHPGIDRVLTAADAPENRYAIMPGLKDQPVLAENMVRMRGEGVVALVGERSAIEAVPDAELPISYQPREAMLGVAAATAPDAFQLHENRPGNILAEGRVRKGDIAAGFANSAAIAQGQFETAYVEHAYIEPEAGWARRVGERIEVHVSTQTPMMDRDEVADVMKLAHEDVRIIPTACGGGFGGKLDLSVQPLIAIAAWLTKRPVGAIYSRPESMASTTKRHPASIAARSGCDGEGRLQAVEFHADVNTGAYASWGPTVAGRVPVHAMGPYFVPHVATSGRAVLTNGPSCGAFRGFGVPQAAIAHETLLDDLAEQLGIDRLQIRLTNALRPGQATGTGQVLEASAGLAPCLELLEPHWRTALDGVRAFNSGAGHLRRGVGIGCMWYGIGNTGLSNPSTMRVTLDGGGKLMLYNGAVDIGQGSTTIMAQICADGLGLPVAELEQVVGDTDLTADAGKTSASRQTFVSGRAAQLAGEDLRHKILRQANAGRAAEIELAGGVLIVRDGGERHEIDLSALPADSDGAVLEGQGTFDPPTIPLDENGQGSPYASYGFAAQIAMVEVDTELGTTKVLKIIAAHDVGRAINPIQVEGQVEGGIAQGLGLALMEEYVPGRNDNLHDYLIPTIGDIPEIEVLVVEDEDPLGPYGAKGVGEPGLIPTAPAIFGAIRHATGVRLTRAPALPHRLRAAILEKERSGG
ncbi:MAG: molybdopterin-dependent oxidoreductase [Rhodospirillaceae bacterium]|nr:molybdopterin-dependent oxidoreductase [Rhodospirillaceae bacterium]